MTIQLTARQADDMNRLAASEYTSRHPQAATKRNATACKLNMSYNPCIIFAHATHGLEEICITSSI